MRNREKSLNAQMYRKVVITRSLLRVRESEKPTVSIFQAEDMRVGSRLQTSPRAENQGMAASSSLSLRARKPGALMSEDRRRRMWQLNQKGGLPFSYLFAL